MTLLPAMTIGQRKRLRNEEPDNECTTLRDWAIFGVHIPSTSYALLMDSPSWVGADIANDASASYRALAHIFMALPNVL